MRTVSTCMLKQVRSCARYQPTQNIFNRTFTTHKQDTLSPEAKKILEQEVAEIVAAHSKKPQRPLPKYDSSKLDKSHMTYFMDIDEDGLLEKPIGEYVDPKTNPVKTRLTALAADLQNQITIRGPLSISDWIFRCMQDAKNGYYMTKKDIIGGDFITSPEISQMFGELIGIWLYDTWSKMGEPPIVDLIELGPGYGTLMSDILRALKHFPKLYNGITIHFVETSPIMRKKQQVKLNIKLVDSQSVFANTTSQTLDQLDHGLDGEPISGLTDNRVRVTWHHSLKSVPTKNPILLLAHEFFDALPVWQFQHTKEHGWCEVVVDTDFTSDSPHHFRFALTPGPTPVTHACMSRRPGHVGDRAEVPVVAITVIEEIAARLASQGGAALIIDYGFVDRKAEGVSDFTLQAVKEHKFVHPLDEPGLVDLTTLVDFGELEKAVDRYALMKNKSIVALPVIHQSIFLRNMHIGTRLEHLISTLPDEPSSEEEADKLIIAAARLIDPEQMGSLFKVMAIVPEGIAEQVSAWWDDERTAAKISKRATQNKILHSVNTTQNKTDKKN